MDSLLVNLVGIINLFYGIGCLIALKQSIDFKLGLYSVSLLQLFSFYLSIGISVFLIILSIALFKRKKWVKKPLILLMVFNFIITCTVYLIMSNHGSAYIVRGLYPLMMLNLITDPMVIKFDDMEPYRHLIQLFFALSIPVFCTYILLDKNRKNL